MNEQAIADFVRFVIARHRMYVNRAKGGPPPWSSDEILSTYRFCNVYRELDRVTKYIRAKYTGDSPKLWFDLVVARMVNNPDTLAELPVYSEHGWLPGRFIEALHVRAKRGDRVFNPAYIVSTNGFAMDKAEYLAQKVLTPIWVSEVALHKVTSIARAHKLLMQFQGLGSFMAAQVVADLKNTKGQPLYLANDWWTWAAPGPGSLRGMNRIMGRGPVVTWPKGTSWLDQVRALRVHVNKAVQAREWSTICAQDVQNCLCEFDKYERVRLGEGKPKQLFRPNAA